MAKSSGSMVQLIGVRWRLRGDQLELTRDDGPCCETCRWWDRQETISLHDGAIPKEDGYCEVLGIGRPPEFGCIQWEAKK